MPRNAGRNKAPSDRDAVVALVDTAWLFTDQADIAYFIYETTRDGRRHQEAHAIRSQAGERILRNHFKARHDRWPSAQGFRDGLDALEASAHGRRMPVGLRTMPYEKGFAVDLGDDDWTRAIVNAGGWSLANTGPLFRRMQGSLPLPTPVAGGSLNTLRPFINVRDDGDWSMILGWLVYAMQPRGPYPILVLHGEQGTSKSTVARILVSLVDPNNAPLISAPRDDRELVVVACSRHVLALDNLSNIDTRLKDGLCRLATGSGLATRKMYSDDDVIVLNARRPIILNGINDLLLADDLSDRAISITLPPIPECRRKPEGVLWAEFERVRFEVLGALLDATVQGLAATPLEAAQGIPRMADFACFASAAAQVWGVERDEWLRHYRENRQRAIESGLAAHSCATALRNLISDRRQWNGSLGQLLTKLNDGVEDAVRDDPTWPKSARGLGNQLRVLAPALRSVGVEIQTLGRTKRGYPVCITNRTPVSDVRGVPGERCPTLDIEVERRKRGEKREEHRSPRTPSSPPPGSRTSGGGS